MQVQQVQLKNQLNTLFVHSEGSTMASLQIWFRAGSALEKKEERGIAHFLEHMFFKGTRKYPGATIAKEVERWGGEMNAFTSFDYTCYYINIPNTQILKAVDILANMISAPLFKKTDIVPERDVVFEEYRRSQDSPSQYAFQEVQKNSFGGAYAQPILGNKKTILNFSQQQLKNFRKRFYNRQNTLFIVSGDLSKQQKKITQTLESYSFPSGEKSSFPKFSLKTKPKSSWHKKDVKQAMLYLTFQAPAFETKAATAEDLAWSALGHGETSALYQKMVMEDSLATAASASTMFFADGGCHFLRVACPEKNLSKVYKRLIKLLKELTQKGFTAEEVSKLKNQYIASKTYQKESLENYAFSLGHGFAQNEDIHSDAAFIERANQVSVQEVNEAFKTIFSRHCHGSLQLPEEAKPQTQELQKFLAHFPFFSSIEEKIHKLKSTPSRYDSPTQLIQLKEGIELIYRHHTATPSFAFQAYLKGGLALEDQETNGSYSLIAQLLTKGNKTTTYHDLKWDLENKASSLSGFSGKDAYGLTLHGLSAYRHDLFHHFFNSLLTPDFSSKHLQHEKEIISRALENQERDPVKQCFRQVSQHFFAGHPYSFNPLGTESNLKKFKTKDLLTLHQQRLKSSPLVLCYVGDAHLEEVLNLLKKPLAALKSRAQRPSLKSKILAAKTKTQHTSFDREQTQIFMGYPAFPMASKEALYLRFLDAHLSGQSSDLFVDVRDKKGLCYAVQSVNFNALQGGYWGIYIAAGHDKAQAAIQAIAHILKNLAKKGLSNRTVQQIKDMLEGQHLMSLQAHEDYANAYSIPVLHQLGLDYPYQQQEQLKKITTSQLNTFLKKFLNQPLSQFIVGKDI